MSLEHDCARFAEDLARELSVRGGSLDRFLDESRGCSRCLLLLSALGEALPEHEEVEPLSDQYLVRVVDRTARVVKRLEAASLRMRIVLGVVISASLLALQFWLVWHQARKGILQGHMLLSAFTVAAVGGWLGTLGFVKRVRADGLPSILRCRWNGRQLQGVCVGIGEYFAISPWIPRVVLVTLAVFSLGGLEVYLLLALLIRFHPDDRQHMAWFRVRRFVARNFGR